MNLNRKKDNRRIHDELIFFKHHYYQVMQISLFCSVIDEKTKRQDEKHPHEQQMKYFGKVIKTLSHPSNKFTSIFFHYITLIISASIKLQPWRIYYSFLYCITFIPGNS